MNRHRNLSFYIESLLLLLFLLAALVVLIRVFGAAQYLGERARGKTDAALILQTVSADFSAQAEPYRTATEQAKTEGQAQLEFCCDDQGNEQPDGRYCVAMELRSESRPTGRMILADICVKSASEPDEQPLGEVTTSLYCPELTSDKEAGQS